MAQEPTLYLLLDSTGTALAQARREGPPSGDLWQMRVLDDDGVEQVLKHKKFKLMSITDSSPSYEGVMERSRNDMVQLRVRKAASSENDMRKNLRVPVRFRSFIYPVSGRWGGRREVESNDLSCGGVAFYTDHSLQIGEQVEIVIPVTSQPLVVRCELLRQRRTEHPASVMYAAKFVDLCNDEETLLRESVFNLQLSGRPRTVGGA